MRQKVDPIFILFFVSGFAGLVYEAIWTHYIKLFLGHAAYAQTLVLVVFIGGLALGAWLCGHYAHRVRNPLRLYALIEGAIGLGSLVFHPVFISATDWGYATLLPAACDQQSAFCAAQWLLSALLLLPQSILLGATFPLVSSAVLRTDSSQPGHDVAALYFLNSLGAVLGVLAAAFVLLPALGLPGTMKTIAFLNLLLALGAFLLSRVPPPPLAIERIAQDQAREGDSEKTLLRVLLAVAFLTGLSSFIYEIAWIRMLSLVLGASTHSFELMLASFILGLALGGAWIRGRVDRTADSVRLLAMVQLVMGVAAAATLPIYIASFDVMAWILSAVSRNEGGFLIFSLASTGIALAVMLPATFCAGATLPLITYRLLRSSSGEKSLGLVYAVNTLGSIIGVVIAVHLLLTTIGVRGALLVGAAIDVALGVFLLMRMRARGAALRFPGAAVAAIAALVAIGVGFQVDPHRSASGVFRTGGARLPQSDEIVFHRDGKTATVDVIRNTRGVVAIRTNGKPDASLAMGERKQPSGDEYTQALLAVLPLGHQPAAKTAAVIGFGSGMTSALLLASPTLQRVDTIEIEPAMIEGAQAFRPFTDAAYLDPRSRIVIDDAKSYFARGRERYDLIISEPSNPWVSGVASLFTQEFYQRLSGYLNDGGVLTQWLHAYEIDAPTLASILRAVGKVFPHYALYSTNDSDIMVVARKGAPVGAFDGKVLALPALQPALARLNLTDARLIDRRLVATSEVLGPFFASYGVAANSDYFPVVDHRASKTRFTQVRVSEIIDLQASSVPILEMLGGARPPATEPVGENVVTYRDAATRDAWTVYHAVKGGASNAKDRPLVSARDLGAEVVRSWAGCTTSLTFDQVLPSILSVADLVNTRLHPDLAAPFWRALAESPCGRRLEAKDRAWLEMLEAIARRDGDAMRATSVKLLDTHTEGAGPITEHAFLAAVTGTLCRGNRQAAKALLEKGQSVWMRPGEHAAEVRLLESLALAPEDAPLPRTAYCGAR